MNSSATFINASAVRALLTGLLELRSVQRAAGTCRYH